MRKLLILLLAALLPAALPAQSLPALLIPEDPDAVVLGAFSRDRFESNRSSLYASLWSPTVSNLKNIGFSQILNFREWSFDASVKTAVSKSYESVGIDGRVGSKFTPYDLYASLGASRKIGGGLSAGALARFCYSTLAPSYKATAAAFDIRLEYASEHCTAGIAVCNVGTPVNYRRSSNPLPSMLRAGGVWKPVRSFMAGGELDCLFGESSFMAAVGARYTIADIVFLQAGYHLAASEDAPVPSYLAVGIGGRFRGFEISAACLLASEMLNYTPCVSLSYNF